MSNVIPFPISNTECQSATMGGLSTPELRERAKWNLYTSLRRQGLDHVDAYFRMESFARDMDRINSRFEVKQHA